ncbi:unnamed protein product, partial [Closterium sp. Naga37s-1]
PCGSFYLLHSPIHHTLSAIQGVGKAIRTVMARIAGIHEFKDAMEMRMRALDMQLEAAERRRVAEMREMRGQVEERERELAEHKDVMVEADRRRELVLRELRQEARKGEDEMRAALAREREERRREVQELNLPRAMEELAACKEWQRIQDMKMNVELEISKSEGPWKTAWE